MKRGTAVEFVSKEIDGAITRCADYKVAAERIVAALEGNRPWDWDPEEHELPKQITKLAIWHPSGSITACFNDGSHRAIGYVYDEFIGTVGPDFCDAYNRLQAGELVDKTEAQNLDHFAANSLEAALRSIAAAAGVSGSVDYIAKHVVATIEAARSNRDESTAALQRLAREAGVPDDGPDEIVGAVLAVLRNKEVTLGAIGRLVREASQ